MVPTATRAEFQSSDLGRNPTEVFSAAEERPIRVTRRGAEPLVLMTEREADQSRKLLEFAAVLIAVTLDDHGTLVERMADRFPWMLALSADDQEACVRELISAARASFSTETPHLVAVVYTGWRETAEAIAAGLGRLDVDWLKIDEPVGRP